MNYKFNKTASKLALFLNKPYDLLGKKKYRLAFSLSVSFFVWFFLFSFGVFDFDYFPLASRFFYTGVYSLFCLTSLLINFFLIQDFVIKKLTILSTILWFLWLMFCVALFNSLLTIFVFRWEDFSVFTIVKNQIYVLGIGVLVTPIVVLLHYNYILRERERNHYNKSLNTIHSKNDNLIDNSTITLQSQYNEGKFELYSKDLIYIQSADNYVDICFKKNEETIQHKLIRNSLTQIENNLTQPELKRCHRSFIVNTSYISSIKGNVRGYRIIINEIDFEIPFSRTYKDAIFSSINT